MEEVMGKTARESVYEKEKAIFSPYATFSENTKGRLVPQEDCFFRTPFQRDRDRIIYSNSFKRLKNKTQVFFSPEGDHYITRLTHTFDVSQIARSITRSLGLNEDLAEAIALGHDLGHTPFGHVGEKVLNKLSPHGFQHNKQSLRVVDVLERDGKGLNLTYEVRDGILQHKLSGKPATLEGVAVSYADRIAYINHDIEDAIRARILRPEDLPQNAVETLGKVTKERINTAISDIYTQSKGQPFVKMSDEVAKATSELRAFMFERVYNLTNKSMQERAERLLTMMFEYFLKHENELPSPYKQSLDKYDKETVVCDYISGMTDKYAISVFEKLFIPTTFSLAEVNL